jgi:hypothetical protein
LEKCADIKCTSTYNSNLNGSGLTGTSSGLCKSGRNDSGLGGYRHSISGLNQHESGGERRKEVSLSMRTSESPRCQSYKNLFSSSLTLRQK